MCYGTQIRRPRHLTLLVIAIIMLVLSTSVHGQRKRASSRKPSRSKTSDLADRFAKSKEHLIEAIQRYKASLQELAGFYESDVNKATEVVEKGRELYAKGAISRKDMADSLTKLAEAQAKLEKVRTQISETDTLIAEAHALDQLAKFQAMPIGAYHEGAGVIRYNGPAAWSLLETAKIKNFFAERFGRPLPISAFGQTSVHDRMGFDHHQAIDVAIHPDSFEGRALSNYLRGAGIPFIAFRYGIPGSATSAHFHIGKPSRRVVSSSNEIRKPHPSSD